VRFGLFAVCVVCVAALPGCGENGAVPRVYAPAQTAVIVSTNNVCVTTYTIHDDGTAKRTSQACPQNAAKSETLPITIASNLFSDLQTAQPLSALPACPTVDTSLTVAWNGQQSRNLGACTISSPAEIALAEQIALVMTAFEPVP
jgi:hypothetical protein